MTAAMCRAQEAVQRELLITEPLENRRRIAATAEKFWAKEAALAEKREAKNKEQATDAANKLASKPTEETANGGCYDAN